MLLCCSSLDHWQGLYLCRTVHQQVYVYSRLRRGEGIINRLQSVASTLYKLIFKKYVLPTDSSYHCHTVHTVAVRVGFLYHVSHFQMADIYVGCHSFHSGLVNNVVSTGTIRMIIDFCQQTG